MLLKHSFDKHGHAVLKAFLFFAIKVSENFVQNEGKLKYGDKTCWQNDKTC